MVLEVVARHIPRLSSVELVVVEGHLVIAKSTGQKPPTAVLTEQFMIH
jgi:hypothetical protein